MHILAVPSAEKNCNRLCYAVLMLAAMLEFRFI